ncbi:hypothetical protein Tco_1090157 [Tanacetum coccineum]|uniref:Uncharacterized protein n=1 Tax=Tanacetum coccineum TaxID=301880 RepID=A0ABQ5I4D2_9ASTR
MNQSPLGELREAFNSTNLSMMWTVMMDREVDKDYGIAKRPLEVVWEVHASLSTREQQAKDLTLMNDLILKISKTQLRTFDKHEFIGYAKKF